MRNFYFDRFGRPNGAGLGAVKMPNWKNMKMLMRNFSFERFGLLNGAGLGSGRYPTGKT
jgi:hypothetical protein